MNKFLKQFFRVAPLIIISWIVLFLFGKYVFQFENDPLINIVNSIFSAMALAGVIVTISIQQEELSLQLNEQKQSRQEYIEQNKTLRKQRFENTFFNLLTLHNSITEKISYRHDGIEYKGREVIRFVFDQFKGRFLNEYREAGLPEITEDTIDAHRTLVGKHFFSVYLDFEEFLGHYFRNFINVIDFTQSSELIEESERGRYYTIIRSQLNSYEILLHFYNFNSGVATLQKSNFDLLGLGQHLNTGLLPHIEHTYIYDPPHVVKAALRMKKQKQ
jgi:uncharacterized membrane protein